MAQADKEESLELYWLAVKAFNLSYHMLDTEYVIRFLDYGSLN